MKNARRLLLTFLLVFSLVLSAVPAAADGLGSAGMDVVLVIDTSGSMKYTDSGKVALDAAKLFVDMMDCSGSRVGLVSFSDTLGAVVSLTPINSQTDKDTVKNTIDGLDYAEDTDIGIAMEKALEVLNAGGDIGNKKAIIFFTDGAIDLPDAENEEQAEAESKTKAQNAAASAAASGIPVYTIGLDASAQDSQYQLDEALIQEIASTTGGKEYTVTNSDDLPSIFNEIFANFVESEIIDGGTITIQDSNTYESLGFTIPNDSVMEANIILLSTARLSDIMLIDPSGNTQTIDNTTVSLSIQNQYSLLKMFTPQAGNWTLQVKGDSGCQVQVNLLFNYDVVLKASATATADGASITAYLENKGQPLTDDAIYADFTNVVARVTYADGTSGGEFPMTYSAGQFIGSVTVNPGTTATVVVNAQSSTMYRESDPMTVTVAEPETEPPETEPQITASLTDPIVLKGFLPSMAKTNIDLSGSFTTTSGNALTYTVQSADSSVATAELDGTTLKLKGVKKGETTVTVEATDPAGVTASQTVTVQVSPTLTSILPIIIGIVALILVIVLIIVLVSMKPPRLEGYLYWHIEEEGSYAEEGDEEHPLGLDGTGVTLGRVVGDASLAVADADLNKIEISGIKKKKGGGIQVKSKAVRCKLQQGGADVKSARVRNGDGFAVAWETEDGTVALLCYYSTEPWEG